MKKTILLIAVAFVAACNSVHSNANNSANTSSTPAHVAQHTPAADGIKRVTTAELDALLKDGKAVVIDVRNQAMYDAGHIRGAKLIPVGEIANRTNELPKDKTIVTYCS